jgi:hypothetical protein
LSAWVARTALCVVACASSGACLPARADSLDDDLNTVWEATWDQRGSPGQLVRWQQPIRYRFVNDREPRQRGYAITALTAAAEAAGVAIGPAEPSAAATPVADAASQAPAASTDTGYVDIEFVDELALGAIGCDVSHRWRNFAITHVRMRLRPSQTWSCVHHEAMHALGVRGHPLGRTVLSYFPYRKDVLMPMDRLMLAAWYDRTLQPGATPFEVLWVAGQHLLRQPDLGVESAQAEQRRQRHYEDRLRDMEAFVRGEADVPVVIKRSGRASPGHIEEARVTMAHYLGLVYRRGTGVAKDDSSAARWLKHAAERSHHPSQVLLARALAQGLGVATDRVEAHRWYQLAVRGGNTVAQRELDALEKTMEATDVDKARALGPR